MAVRAVIDGIGSAEALARALSHALYLADEGLATAADLAFALGKPLMLEGPPGGGKTEGAKALGRRLIRLPCHKRIDASVPLCEWNYPRQMLALRQSGGTYVNVWVDEFLPERPLLAALREDGGAVLLIDEIDRAAPAFEAFLLGFLADFQIAIPERGPVKAAEPPAMILASNRTRELDAALRRRCVHHWIDDPDREREIAIVMARASAVARPTAEAVGRMRARSLAKTPGVAETVEWAEAATLLNAQGSPWPLAFRGAIGAAVMDQDDMDHLAPRLDALLGPGLGAAA